MRFYPRLWQQGLILAGLPLLFQFVFIAVLYHALSTAEDELARAEHARDIIGHSDLLEKLTKADNLFWIVRLARNDRLEREYDGLLVSIRSDLANLKQLVGDDPRKLKTVGLISHQADRMLVFIEKERSKLDPKDEQACARYNNIFRSMGTALAWNVDDLVRPYRAIEESNQRKFRDNLRTILTAAVCLNAFLALGLVLIFHKSTLSRLRVLTDNTVRFADGKPLLSPVSGSDEIAELDGFFRRMVARVEEADRLKGEFLAMITHDIRTPLASMQGLLNLIANGAYGDSLSAKARDSLDAIDQEFQRLIKLINDLLDAERFQSGKFELNCDMVPVAYILESSFQAIRGTAEKRHISIVIPDCADEVYADGDRLVQVLVNLVSNAIKFSPDGSEIRIGVESSDGWIYVRVKDNGPGIPPEYTETIFDRFRQVKGDEAYRKGGAGLGLAICKEIISAHGGKIGVDSEPGKGATFWFALKLSAGPAAPGDVHLAGSAE